MLVLQSSIITSSNGSMQAYHINQDTVSKLYNQMALRHVISDSMPASLLLFTDNIQTSMARPQFEFERVLPGAVLLFQSQGDLDTILAAATHPLSSKTYIYTIDWNKVIKRQRFVLSIRPEDFYAVQYASDIYGKPVEQLIDDVTCMYNPNFLPSLGISNYILLEQCRDLAIRWLVISISRTIFALSIAAVTGTQGFGYYVYLRDIDDMIGQGTFSLEQIPIERRDAFNELIYQPILYTEKNQTAFEEWTKKTADHGLTQCIQSLKSPPRDTFTMLMYYRYGPRAVNSDESNNNELKLDLAVIPDVALAIEI